MTTQRSGLPATGARGGPDDDNSNLASGTTTGACQVTRQSESR